jgi:hypothetical protein
MIFLRKLPERNKRQGGSTLFKAGINPLLAVFQKIIQQTNQGANLLIGAVAILGLGLSIGKQPLWKSSTVWQAQIVSLRV